MASEPPASPPSFCAVVSRLALDTETANSPSSALRSCADAIESTAAFSTALGSAPSPPSSEAGGAVPFVAAVAFFEKSVEPRRPESAEMTDCAVESPRPTSVDSAARVCTLSSEVDAANVERPPALAVVLNSDDDVCSIVDGSTSCKTEKSRRLRPESRLFANPRRRRDDADPRPSTMPATASASVSSSAGSSPAAEAMEVTDCDTAEASPSAKASPSMVSATLLSASPLSVDAPTRTLADARAEPPSVSRATAMSSTFGAPCARTTPASAGERLGPRSVDPSVTPSLMLLEKKEYWSGPSSVTQNMVSSENWVSIATPFPGSTRSLPDVGGLAAKTMTEALPYKKAGETSSAAASVNVYVAYGTKAPAATARLWSLAPRAALDASATSVCA
mmetsp:Transcript_30139/g.103683  ORF Transcript_30139/g.103683 Transcript_30139/m.103683 type:complete len:392 (-) Transcript_30139:579-1754(-)